MHRRVSAAAFVVAVIAPAAGAAGAAVGDEEAEGNKLFLRRYMPEPKKGPKTRLSKSYMRAFHVGS